MLQSKRGKSLSFLIKTKLNYKDNTNKAIEDNNHIENNKKIFFTKKKCEICEDALVSENEKFRSCEICEDAFHEDCLLKKDVVSEVFYCKACIYEHNDKIQEVSLFFKKVGKQVNKVSL